MERVGARGLLRPPDATAQRQFHLTWVVTLCVLQGGVRVRARARVRGRDRAS